MPANPGTDRAAASTDSHPRACHPLTSRRPLPSLVPSRLIPVNQPRSDVQKADRPTDCRLPAPFSRRGTRASAEGETPGYMYMRGTEQKNGREFVLGRRGTNVVRARRGTAAGEDTGACAWNSYAARKRVAFTDGAG